MMETGSTACVNAIERAAKAPERVAMAPPTEGIHCMAIRGLASFLSFD